LLHARLPEHVRLTSGYLANGPASVESAVDEALAAPGVVDAALAAVAHGAEALVIDCMLDPGLDAAREMVTVPVIGCGEAAFSTAAATGPFSVVTVLDRQRRAFEELARRYGIGPALRSVRSVGVSVLDLDRDSEHASAATIREARAAVVEDGAQTVVFGCTGMLGFDRPVAEALDNSMPVIDPLPHAVAVAVDAVRRGARTDKALYPPAERKRIAGFAGWAALDAAINTEHGR
jgi:allantoin racemase